MESPANTDRFTGKAEVYAKYRPGYPRALLEHCASNCGLLPHHVVADIGSGTGKLSELFLSNGNTVFAVEPNADMRREAEALWARAGGFRSVDGRAEKTGLYPRSVDLVSAGQAFHWFEQELTRAEFRRILRPGGWVVLAWNVRDQEATPFLHAYEEFLAKFSLEYGEVHHGRLSEGDGLRAFFSADYGSASIANPREIDFEFVKGGYLSTSYSLPPGHDRFPRAMEQLREIFNAHQQRGRVDAPLRTVVHHGRV
jgi:SAM-dependent methyltransferase